MKKHRVVTTFRLFWLSILVLVAVFWWRSESSFNTISYTTPEGADFIVYTEPGRLFLSWSDMSCYGLTPTPGIWKLFGPRPERLGMPHITLLNPAAEDMWSLRHLLLGTWPGSARKTLFGFSIERTPAPTGHPSTAQFASLMGTADLMEFGIPYWILETLLGLPLVLWLRDGWLALRQRSRLAEGLCQACGYDLRASPVRCPTCGLARKQILPILWMDEYANLSRVM